MVFSIVNRGDNSLIENIKMRNWKTHSESSFEFEKGTNVLIGQMGSGKSSVMDAICYALFGTFPSLQSRRVSLEEVIMNKPNKAEEASIELCFSYGNKTYKIERKIKRKGSTEAKISCEGKVLAGPKPKDVNATVEKAIEINYNLFSRAVYSEQNEIDYFLRLTPKDRKAKFDELLDLQKYETTRANAVTAQNRLKTISADKKAWAKEQKESLEKEEEETLKKRTKEKEKENKSLEEEIEKKHGFLKELNKEIEDLEKTEKEFRNTKETISKNKATAEELEKTIEETKKESQGKNLQQIENEKKETEEQIKELEKHTLETRKQLEKEQDKKNKQGKESAINQKRVEDLNRHLQETEGLGAECPTCKQKLEQKTREQLTKEAKEEIKKSLEKMEALLKEEAQTNSAITKHKEQEQKTNEQKEKTMEQKMKIEQIQNALKKLEEKEKNLEKIKKETKEKQEQLDKLDFDETRLAEKRKLAIEEKSQTENKKKTIEMNKQLIEEIKTGIERIEKAKKQVSDIEQKIQAIDESIEEMSYFINSLIATQHELRETLIATINQAMNDIWQKTYPYKDYISAKMDVSEGTYELKAQERTGNWVRVEGILSGGERSAAAICIRIAFSFVLTRNLSLLILDEPTHNLDQQAVETLGKMMQTHLPMLVEQIFVITHDTEMKKAASGTIYYLEREKNEDSATKPRQLEKENLA